MNALIYLAVWRRPEITKICFMGINRLRKRFPLDALAVISEESMIPLCEEFGIRWTFHENDPLGAKKNHGLNEAMKLDWDYLIEIGSDDLLKDEIFELYQKQFGKHEYFGVKSLVFLDSETGRCRKYSSDTIFGLGRCMSRSLLERACYGVDVIGKENLIMPGQSVFLGKKGFLPVEYAEENAKLDRVEITGKPRYKLWDDHINKCLDNNSDFFLMKKGAIHKGINTNEPLAIDIKGRDNIWKFNPSLGTAHDLDKALQGLSEEEKSALFALWKETAKQKGIEYANHVQ